MFAPKLLEALLAGTVAILPFPTPLLTVQQSSTPPIVGLVNSADSRTATTTCTCSIPAGAQANDIGLLHVLYVNVSGAPTWTDPTGWTKIAEQGLGSFATNYRILVYWRRLDGSETNATISTSSGGSNNLHVAISIWRGYTTSGTPYESLSNNPGPASSSGKLWGSTIMPLGSSRTIINFYSMQNASISLPAGGANGWTDGYRITDAQGGMALSYQDSSSSTAIPVIAETRLTSVNFWASYSLALIKATGAAPSGKTIYLGSQGAGTWTVPSDWNNSSNSIELIGAGGNGGDSAGSSPGSGGAGGQYAKTTNLTLTPGATINYRVGTNGGTVGTSASPGTADTWFDSASTIAYAQGGGNGGAGSSAPVGGSAAAVGSCTVKNGGNAGSTSSALWSGAGGGGAGGPTGVGSNGTAGGGSTNSNGSNGGAGDGGTVSAGSGGTFDSGQGSKGNVESLWATNVGPGSGAGGGARNAGYGGSCIGWGAGGGGASYQNIIGGGMGGPGIIVIKYT